MDIFLENSWKHFVYGDGQGYKQLPLTTLSKVYEICQTKPRNFFETKQKY
jgi:hypothetical protein